MAESLSNILRELRESSGTSLRQAAKDLDVNPAYLSRVERGQKTASKSVQERLANYYDVEPEVVEVATGKLPRDLVEILQRNPDLIDELRERYGSS